MAKNRLDFQAQLSRHSHDISAGYAASLTTGCIVPQFFDIASPGDTYYFNTRLFARLQDVVTAFLGEIDLHVDYFFVPMQMIYTPFGQVFALTDDVLSSQLKNLRDSDRFPLLNVKDSYRLITNSGHFLGHVECAGKESVRLLSALDLNPLFPVSKFVRHDIENVGGERFNDTYLDNSAKMPDNISPWVCAAYQAIYQKYYRNDEFERFDIEAYNLDQYYTSDSFVNPHLLRLRYCQRPSDYFTSVRVSPLASAVNKLGPESQTDADNFPSNGGSFSETFAKINNWLGFDSAGFSAFTLPVEDISSPLSSPSSAYNENGTFERTTPSFVNLTVANDSDNSWSKVAGNIRALFALDKFQRIYGRADKTYDDQILAHFGIKIPHDVKHDLTHIKHYHAVIQSDPIYSMANVQNSSTPDTLVSTLGQVGGQGSCELSTFDDKPEKFRAPVHGVFMCVAYAVTKPRYVGTFSKLHELDQRLKFPIPEFDKLGAQPLFVHEFDPSFLGSPTLDATDNQYIASRAGWQNRYQEFKRKYNRASLNYWPDSVLVQPSQGEPFSLNNIYAPWVLSRPVFNAFANNNVIPQWESRLVAATQFFERPDALDAIMVQKFRPDWDNEWYYHPNLILQSDPIITDFFCKCKKVSWMSETGEPNL